MKRFLLFDIDRRSALMLALLLNKPVHDVTFTYAKHVYIFLEHFRKYY